ncbi:hypothetical protein OG21DRAFT_1479840 [Imleria badia]|nr:hypothetical protein OG21DRAFT_1479840 [Imleria badia]
MAATPPRPASPAPRPVVLQPKPGYNLQISPNLEALLQHDELTRRNSSSPTSAYHASPSSGFPISLPPPPPRKGKGIRKAGQREQEPFPTTRGKEGHRRKSAVVGSDFWPDALPTTDGCPAGQSTSGTYSRPVTPNPYLNPTPVLIDEAQTPKQADKSLPNDPKPGPDSSRSAAESRGRTSASDPSQRPSTALHKVEKILWMGRDSLNLFSGSANAVKRDSDRRNDRTEFGDFDAVQDSQMRQVPVPHPQTVSRPASRFGDRDTATVTLSSKSATSYLHLQQGGPYSDPFETASYLTHVESRPSREQTPIPPLPPAQRQPCLSLPCTSMSHNSSHSVDTVTRNDYLSFIDFFSPSTAESSFCNTQDNAQEISSPRPRLQSINIPPSGLYAMSQHNRSSTTLTSMKFAPPSPTALAVHQPSPISPSSGASSSSVALSTMRFAPPSPSVECVPLRLQPLSGPPSPYSPLEFAPPPGPQHDANDEPCLLIAPELPADRGRKLKSKKRSKSSSPYHVHDSVTPLPPTTNELDANERADRIRRNRKLARVFGRTPGVEEPIIDTDDIRAAKKSQPPSLAALLTKPKSHRHAVSVSVSLKAPGMKTEPSTPWQTGSLWSPDGRRHSTALATDFTLYMEDEQKGTPPKKTHRSRKTMESLDAASARSFIDLSDEEVHDDDVSELSCFATHQSRLRRLHHSNSTPSFVESLDSEAQAELERRRKREKLAKLHRFLGSRVPPEAITGSVFGSPLPPMAPPEGFNEQWVRVDENEHLDELDRGKEELDEREKALNVRRAQKMERVFGTPPPQVLFHTRQSRPTVPHSQPTSPADFNPYVLTLDLPSSSRNPNQSAYTDDTPQSSPSSFAQSFTDSFAESLSGYQHVLAQSSVYLNYQHSLNSLIDIIDRDDRKSLMELHHFLHGEADDESPSDEEVAINPRRFSNATSLRSERRHSLPSKASMTSLSSEFYASPKASQFQIRRRKAAKLTNFFGVDYRELIQNILESIEKGVEEERKQGTLQPEEVEASVDASSTESPIDERPFPFLICRLL